METGAANECFHGRHKIGFRKVHQCFGVVAVDKQVEKLSRVPDLDVNSQDSGRFIRCDRFLSIGMSRNRAAYTRKTNGRPLASTLLFVAANDGSLVEK